jgi:hypothetical protein
MSQRELIGGLPCRVNHEPPHWPVLWSHDLSNSLEDLRLIYVLCLVRLGSEVAFRACREIDADF